MEAYSQYGNFGNVAKTLKAARLLDRSITRKDVQQWKDKNHAPLRAHCGLNSYVAKKPKEEYQMDLMFFRPGQGDGGEIRGRPADGGYLHQILLGDPDQEQDVDAALVWLQRY